jgi:excisionase family DNA binding protein
MVTRAATKSAPVKRAKREALPRQAYSIREFGDMLGISRPTVYDLIAAGKLRTVMVGARRLIPATEIGRILADES